MMVGNVKKYVRSPVVTQQVSTLSTLPMLSWQWRGHTIRYTVVGTGQPLMLLHGFGAAIGHWRNNIPVLAAANYQVYALDLLGFGGSDKPSVDYSLELWQDLICDFWAAHIQAPTVFVGNSIGALLSLMMAANHPNLAAGAVLLNCAGGLNHRPEELNLPLRLVMTGFTRLAGSKLVGGFIFNRIRQKSRIRASLKQVYGNSEAITDDLVDLIHAPACDPGAQQVFASILTAPAGPRISELLPQVKCPLLVVWGEADPWTPVSGGDIFQQWGDRLSIQFTTIPKTGHCPHDERPELVNPLILDWLSQSLPS
jgi:pimeloyl-ACP methyl ester carboxylesterase